MQKFFKKLEKTILTVTLALSMVFGPTNITFADESNETDEKIVLGDAVYNSDGMTFSFPNAKISFGDNTPQMMTVTVSAGSVTAPSDTKSATFFTDMAGTDGTHKSLTLLWGGASGVTASDIQSILQDVIFTYAEGMTITVTADANETNLADQLSGIDGATLTQWAENGHYYLYVPHIPTAGQKDTFMSWREAYDTALDLTLNGMKGYLVSIEEAGEQTYLSNLANSNVWVGATSLLLQDSSDTAKGTKLDGSAKIGDGVLMFQEGFTSTADALKKANSRTDPSPLNQYYYWASGPSAGQTIDTTNITLYDVESVTRELNGYPGKTDVNQKFKDGLNYECCTAAYVGTKTGFNDIPEGNYYYKNFSTTAMGYIVEFGGWTGHDSVNADLTCTVNANLSAAPKTLTVTASVEKQADGTVAITLDGLNKSDYYAILDKDGNVITANVTTGDGTLQTGTGDKGWFTKSGDNTSGRLIWTGLDAKNGPFTVVTSQSGTDAPSKDSSSGSTICAVITSASYAGTHASWYTDEVCTTSAASAIRNSQDTSDKGNRTVYIKADDGYKWADTPSVTVKSADGSTDATTETVSTVGATVTAITSDGKATGVYEVTYTLPADTSIQLEILAPKQVITPGVTLAGFSTSDAGILSRTYDGTSVSVDKVTMTMDGKTETISSQNYKTTWYQKKTDGTYTALNEAPKNAGDYKISVELTAGSHIGSAEKEFTIEKKPVTITGAKADDKAYDGTTDATLSTGNTYSIEGLVDGDTVTADASKASGAFSDAGVGDGKTVTFAGFALTGDDADNYTLKEQPKTTANITTATVTIDSIGGLTGGGVVLSGTGSYAYNKEYDGTKANVLVDTSVTPTFTANGVTLSMGASDYTYKWVQTADASGNATNVELNEAPSERGTYALTVTATSKDQSYTGTFTYTVKIQDTIAPTGTISAFDSSWRSFVNTVTFGKLFNEKQAVQITAQDKSGTDSVKDGSGVAAIFYHIETGGTSKSYEEIKALTDADWTSYTGTFYLNADDKYVVYAKIVDNAGNMSFLSSDGAKIDLTGPTVTIAADGSSGNTQAGKTLTSNTTFTDGYLTFKVSDDDLQSVYVNGEKVTLKDGTYTLPSGTYTITATDLAGNTTTLQNIKITGKIPTNGDIDVEVKTDGVGKSTKLVTDSQKILAMLIGDNSITAEEMAEINQRTTNPSEVYSGEVVLSVTDNKATIEESSKTKLLSRAEQDGYTIGQYFDVTLTKYIYKGTENKQLQKSAKITETMENVVIAVQVNDDLINTDTTKERTYYVLRNHAGTVTVINGTFDASTKLFTFGTNLFSDYVIAYKDTNKPKTDDNGKGGNSSSNSGNVSGTVTASVSGNATAQTTAGQATLTSNANTVKTGDDFPLMTIVTLLMAAAVAEMIIMIFTHKRKKSDEEHSDSSY